jgi:tetratricopeptide (TPR) repeat protein
MRNLIPALLAPAICLSLAAQSSGRVSGKILDKAGKPVPNCLITMSRKDINWTKEIKVNANGSFMQVGLEAKDYKFTVTAEGYQAYNEEVHVPLGDTLSKNITLLTTKEAAEEATKKGLASMSAADQKSMSGSMSFNSAVEFYNQQKYAEALPFVEKAVADLKEAMNQQKEGEGKKTLETQLPTAERVYGICLFEVGKADPEKKDLVLKAEPYLADAFARNPKDQRLIANLIEVSKAKGDAAATQKYQAALDALIGPRPEVAYNEGVTAFNNGDFKAAKVAVNKAIAMDPKYADSYWLLGVVDFSLNDLKGAKESFKKYMEIAPTGKKAGEVKEFLRELK